MSGRAEEAGNIPPVPGMHVSNKFFAIRDNTCFCLTLGCSQSLEKLSQQAALQHFRFYENTETQYQII